MIISTAGARGLYTGWRLHFLRDTTGTALYFAEYDVMRWLLGRKRSDYHGKGKARDDEQGEVPEWARSWLPKSLIPFVCGSVAGVSSWALIYPIDVSLTSRGCAIQLTSRRQSRCVSVDGQQPIQSCADEPRPKRNSEHSLGSLDVRL